MESPDSISDEINVLINLIFFNETNLLFSKNEKKKPCAAPFSFANDPITLVYKKGKKINKIEFREMTQINVHLKEEKELFDRIGIKYMTSKKGKLRSKQTIIKKEIIIHFKLKSDFKTWKTVLRILYSFRNRSRLSEITSSSGKRLSTEFKNNEPTRSTRMSFSRTIVVPSKTAKLDQKTYNLYAFGNNEWGQLGIGNKLPIISTPEISIPLMSYNVKAVSCGWNHMLILMEEDVLLQVGNRVGTGMGKDFLDPKPVYLEDKTKVVDIACGESHSLVLDDNGKMYAWGCNLLGQLGVGEGLLFCSKPVKVEIENKFITKITCGNNFSVCLTSEGSVYSWGDSLSGCLGQGDENSQYTPKLVEKIKNVRLISAGCNHVVASLNVSNECHLYSWGWNGCGQLGVGDKIDRLEPTKIATSLNGSVIQISCGESHSAVLMDLRKFATKYIYMWGSNLNGQLGLKTNGYSSQFALVPTAIPFNMQPKCISLGGMHSIILTDDGQVFSTGSNMWSQLGHVCNGLKQKANSENANEPPLKELTLQREPSAGMSNLHKSGSQTKNKPGREHLSHQQTETILPPKLFSDEFQSVAFFSDKKAVRAACFGDSTIILTKKNWIDDEEIDSCMGKFSSRCKPVFTLVSRKHHCRNCGGIFCGPCSSKNSSFQTSSGEIKAFRVCDKCFNKLNHSE